MSRRPGETCAAGACHNTVQPTGSNVGAADLPATRIPATRIPATRLAAARLSTARLAGGYLRAAGARLRFARAADACLNATRLARGAAGSVGAHCGVPRVAGVCLVVVLLVAGVLAFAEPVYGDGLWRLPLDGSPAVLRGFDPPDLPWGAGHRGIDLAASAGEPVYAAGAGRIGYVGRIAGRGIVTVIHDTRRTTYLPVHATVHTGDHVRAGTRIGTMEPGIFHCPMRVCLHWGLLRGDTYLDPLSLLGGGPIRLLPLHASPSTTGQPTPGPRHPAPPPAKASGTGPLGTKPLGVTPLEARPFGVRRPSATPLGTSSPGTMPLGTKPLSPQREGHVRTMALAAATGQQASADPREGRGPLAIPVAMLTASGDTPTATAQEATPRGPVTASATATTPETPSGGADNDESARERQPASADPRQRRDSSAIPAAALTDPADAPTAATQEATPQGPATASATAGGGAGSGDSGLGRPTFGERAARGGARWGRWAAYRPSLQPEDRAHALGRLAARGAALGLRLAAETAAAASGKSGGGGQGSGRPSLRPEREGRPVAHYAESALAGSGGAGLVLLVIALVGRIPWRRPTHTGGPPVRGRQRAMSYHPAGGRATRPDDDPAAPTPDAADASAPQADGETPRDAPVPANGDTTQRPGRVPATRGPGHPAATQAPTTSEPPASADPPATPVPPVAPPHPAASPPSATPTPSPGADGGRAAAAERPQTALHRRGSALAAHVRSLLRRAFATDPAAPPTNADTSHYADVIDLATERRLRRPTRPDDDSA